MQVGIFDLEHVKVIWGHLVHFSAPTGTTVNIFLQPVFYYTFLVMLILFLEVLYNCLKIANKFENCSAYSEVNENLVLGAVYIMHLGTFDLKHVMAILGSFRALIQIWSCFFFFVFFKSDCRNLILHTVMTVFKFSYQTFIKASV